MVGQREGQRQQKFRPSAKKNNQRPEKMGNAAQDAGDREPGASGEGWVVAVGSPSVAVAMVFHDVHWAR